MLKHMTRSKLIQLWFGAVVMIIVAGIAFGTTVSAGTAAMLGALSLVPPAIVLMLWPGVQPRTASDVLHQTD